MKSCDLSNVNEACAKYFGTQQMFGSQMPFDCVKRTKLVIWSMRQEFKTNIFNHCEPNATFSEHFSNLPHLMSTELAWQREKRCVNLSVVHFNGLEKSALEKNRNLLTTKKKNKQALAHSPKMTMYTLWKRVLFSVQMLRTLLRGDLLTIVLLFLLCFFDCLDTFFSLFCAS